MRVRAFTGLHRAAVTVWISRSPMPACLSQGYFNGADWEQLVTTPFCLVPSGSGNALAANCGLWTLETAAYA